MFRKIVSTVALSLLVMCGSAIGADPDFKKVAERVVNESAGVKAGDVVWIDGSPSELAILEALTAAVWQAGAEPIVTLNLPRANRDGLMSVPIEKVGSTVAGSKALTEVADVSINATAIEDPMLFSDVPEERLNAFREAYQPIFEAAQRRNWRIITLGQVGGIPSDAYAESYGLDGDDMRAAFYSALAVPSDTIAERGANVSKAMSGGDIRVTSSAGTDIQFRLVGDSSRVSTGKTSDNDTGQGPAAAYLPAGDYYACIVTDSAEGTVVIPYDRLRGNALENVRLEFENGSLTSMEAERGEDVLREYFDALDENSKKLSLINIGLNPRSAPREHSDYLSWEMSGVTTLFMGLNLWAGCDNPGEGGYSAHLADTTVRAGGDVVVDDGTLYFD